MIYLDNSATTPPCGAALDAVRAALEVHWHNPSALYGQAVEAERGLERARESMAKPLGVAARGLIFTGSGTEADSLAILGAAARFRGRRRVLLFAAEHPAVRETATQLVQLGHEVDWVPATDEGLVDLDAFDAMLDERVALVSCMHVGNETGAVQPLARLSALLRARAGDALLHADGIQAFLRLPARLDALGVDMYSVSAHKVHGPKGVGALAVRGGVKLAPRVCGGGQEGGLRSGTENTAGIAGFAAAAGWLQAQGDLPVRLRAMKLCFLKAVAGAVEGLRVNGPDPHAEASAPHIINLSLPGVGGEVMVHALEAEGVLVGTGAACSSKKREMSAAFQAMRAPRWAAESAIRVSFGAMNTIDQAREAAQAVIRCHQKYRAFQRR